MWTFVFFIGMHTTILCLVGAEPALPLKKCKKYDSPCILEAVNPLVPIFAAGIPEYNVEATDPLYVDAFNNSGSNLNLVVKNVSMTGVKDCVFTKMEMTETRMIGTMLCDIASNGQYEMSGKLLLFPVSGSGNVHVVMNKVLFTGDADIAEVTGKDGKKHWKIKGFRHSYDIQGKAILDFGNLFGENEVLMLPLKKCKKYDSSCILEAMNPLVPIFAAGIPEYNVEALDPLYVYAFNNSGENLNLVVKNVTMTGAKNCVFTKMEMTETRMIGSMLCDIESNGQYEMTGKILLVPVSGSGNVHAAMSKVLFTGDADIAEVVGKDGKKHWKVKGFRHSYDIQGKATLDFGNLFGQNEVLKNAIRELLDNSPKDVISDVGAPAVEAVAKVMYKNINSFFKVKPIEDLVLP